jgi:hypothetical protein
MIGGVRVEGTVLDGKFASFVDCVAPWNDGW